MLKHTDISNAQNLKTQFSHTTHSLSHTIHLSRTPHSLTPTQHEQPVHNPQVVQIHFRDGRAARDSAAAHGLRGETPTHPQSRWGEGHGGEREEKRTNGICIFFLFYYFFLGFYFKLLHSWVYSWNFSPFFWNFSSLPWATFSNITKLRIFVSSTYRFSLKFTDVSQIHFDFLTSSDRVD